MMLIRLAVSLTAFLLFNIGVDAQPVVLQPPKAVGTNGSLTLQLMFKPTRSIEMAWTGSTPGSDLRLVFGRNKGDYRFASRAVTGNSFRFTAASLGMVTGRYYARLTNAQGSTIAELQNDLREGRFISNEVELIVEATTAPKINTPRGTVTDPTPLFSWDPVPGVPAYWIIFSSTPFQITTDANDQIKIQGANIVWQNITSGNSTRYGDVNKDVTYYDLEAPPLNPGQEYSFAVLNVYEESNPVYASAVFGGIVPMRYENPNAIPKPVLISPEASATFNAAPVITFRWSEVTQAASYGINLYQVITQQGVDATVPIWSTTTTNTVIDYPALSSLKNAVYQWNVVAFDGEGGGVTSGTSASPTRNFRYVVENGAFDASAVSSQNTSELISGVEINIRAMSGGVTPGFPSFLQSTSISDSLVVGTYQFTARKDGFADTTINAEIRRRQTTFLRFSMRPLPSFISGVAVDEARIPVARARVTALNQLNGVSAWAETDVTGAFRLPLNNGTYQLSASKPGHLAPQPRVVSLQMGQALQLADSLRMPNDRATLAGAVLNETGGPIQNARVTLRRGTELLETRSDGAGVFALVANSGTWTLQGEKSGFVQSNPRTVTLTVGDQLQNQNLTLAGRANTVSGFIRERITNADGSTGFAPMAGVSVTATPLSGPSVTALSSNNGQYTLSLGSGTFTIRVQRSGYATQSGAPQLVLGFGETYSGINFDLQANPSVVSGKVVSPSGLAINGATVFVEGAGQALTNASGLYTLALPAGRHALSVTRTGFATPTARQIVLDPGQQLSGIDFTMPANAVSVSGRVTSSGSAVSEATLTAFSTLFGTITTNSSENGTFEFSLQPGEWQISAGKAGFFNASSISVTLSAGQSRGGTDFVLTPNTRTLRGIISSEGGTLRNVAVEIVSGSFVINTISQPNGVYSAVLEAGRNYNVTARLTGFKTTSFSTGTVEVSSEVLNRNIEMEANPASIAGLVADQNLRVISGASIIIRNAATGIRVDSVLSQINGQFVAGLSPGVFEVRAQRPGYLPEVKTITVAAGQNLKGLNFSLTENFALLSGNVMTAGAGLENALVTLSGTNGERSAQTNRAGAYIISGLVAGTYQLKISKEGFTGVVQNEMVFNGGQQRTFDAELLPNTGKIEGVVNDLTANPVADAVVTAVGAPGMFQTNSDAAGAYRFEALPLGTYTIAASKSGYITLESATINLTTDEPVKTDERVGGLVRNNGSVRGNITDLGDNSRLSNVNVQLTGQLGSGSAVSSSTGAYLIENLAPGAYTVIFAVDGWESDTTIVEIAPTSPQVTLDRQLARNAGRIIGTIANQQNQPLDFRPVVRLTSASATYEARADENGKFIFAGVKTGVTYKLSSEIYRDGYINAEQQVTIARGLAELTLADFFRVRFNNAAILGNAGLAGVSVQLLGATGSAPLRTFVSEPDGTFRFRFLAEGSYRLVIRQQGYVFAPDTLKSSVAFGEQRVVAFTATPNVGTIRVVTRTGTANLSAVAVSVVSSDTLVIRNAETNAQGIALFSNLPAGKSYTVRPVRARFTSDPETRTIALETGATVEASFNLAANTASISGTVRIAGGVALEDAILRARLLATDQIFEERSRSDGSFTISSLPAGIYRLTARKSGFSIDTLFNINLGAGDQLTGQDLTLKRAALLFLGGQVTFAGAPVSGVQITAVSTSTFTATTGPDGFYFFNNLPVRAGITDTTLYTISMNTADYTASSTQRFTAANIGEGIYISGFKLPSGQITTIVTNGVRPLSGVRIQFARVGGANAAMSITGNDGRFVSSNRLRASPYNLDVSRTGYLIPETPYVLQLPTDTTVLIQEIRLPYTFTPLQEIRADAPAIAEIGFDAQYLPTLEKAELFYRRSGQTGYTSVPLVQTAGKLSGSIPALFTLDDITYFVRVQESGSGNAWISPDATLKPLASGILSRVRITPELNDQILRVNDIYEVNFTIFDGINRVLDDRFTGTTPTGQLNINSIDLRAGVTVERSGMNALFRPTRPGVYRFRVEGRLNGIVITRELSLTVTDAPVSEIVVTRPAARLASSGTHTFTYAAFDAGRQRILLGKNKQWIVDPPERGLVSDNGVFSPASPQTIGDFRILLKDENSGRIGGSAVTSLFALVQPNSSTTLVNGQGFSLNLPAGSLASAAEFSLARVTPEPTKKYIRPKGSNESYVVSDTTYRIVSSLTEVQPTARVTIPVDKSLRHAAGDIKLGWYDPAGLEWQILNPPVAKQTFGNSQMQQPTSVTATGFRQFGQFGIMSANQPLGIRDAAVLPSPFSPDVAPAKIGYILDSQIPPVEVSIIIYTMKGEPIRTILKNDLQNPGRYGSKTGLKEIVWDGLTDGGRKAMNGRYIIEIKAKDARDEQRKLIPVVLVK